MDFSHCTDFISALIGSLELIFPHLSDDFELLQVDGTIAIIVWILATLANDKCLEIVMYKHSNLVSAQSEDGIILGWESLK